MIREENQILNRCKLCYLVTNSRLWVRLCLCQCFSKNVLKSSRVKTMFGKPVLSPQCPPTLLLFFVGTWTLLQKLLWLITQFLTNGCFVLLVIILHSFSQTVAARNLKICLGFYFLPPCLSLPACQIYQNITETF